jgi:hypothetical protein
MPKIILLNGCINSGKSTIANRLKSVVPNLAHVEVDDLHRFISWMPIERAIHLNFENAANITKTFVNAGIDVVFSYPLSKPDYDLLLNKFEGVNADLFPITLFTSLENARRNRGSRKLSEWELNRIEWMYANGLANPGFGELIDNSDHSIEATVEAVIKLAGLSRMPAFSEEHKRSRV